jgi:hypothetical protein
MYRIAKHSLPSCVFVGALSIWLMLSIGQTAFAADADAAGTNSTSDSGSLAQQIAMAVAAIAVLVTLLVVMFRAARKRSDQESAITRLRPEFIFWLNIFYFLVLIAVALAYANNYVSIQQAIDAPVGGIMPIAVPWFGALGAVMISMQGVFFNNEGWKSKFNYWHVARPLTGGIMGSVAFFLLLLINTASGTTPPFLSEGDGDSSNGVNGMIVYWVLAFLVGYREETFRELITRVTDLILRPSGDGEAAAPAVIFKVDGTKKAEIDCGAAGVIVEVQNSGRAPLRNPEVALKGDFEIEEDKVTGQEIAPGDHKTVEVKLTGDADSPPGTLTVKGSNLGAPESIELVAQ